MKFEVFTMKKDKILLVLFLASCPPDEPKPTITDSSDDISTSSLGSTGFSTFLFPTSSTTENVTSELITTQPDVNECVTSCIKEKLIFVTFNTYPGNLLNGLEGADILCSQEAREAGLTREAGFPFRAWLSGNQGFFLVSAIERLSLFEDVSYIRPDGKIIAEGMTQLLSGKLEFSISVDPYGNLIEDDRVWTNTFSNGIGFSEENDCDDWTKYEDLSFSHTGRTKFFDNNWSLLSKYSEQNCNAPARLYCIEQ